MDQAIFAGGCFWCVEPVFRALRGVADVEVGYCGGHTDKPTYEQVCRGDTGHMECARVSFDPAEISFTTLCEVFFATHDPTTPDRQGNDVGTQYASAILYLSDEQRGEATQVRDTVQAALDVPVCTRIEAASTFWPAEPLHREYFRRNPEQGYCRVVIAPKMAKFRRHYATLLRA